MSSTIKSLPTAEAAEMTLFGGGRKHKQKREGMNPYFSTFHLRNVFSTFLWKKKLSITQCCTGSPWHALKVTSAGRAIQHFRAPGSFSMCHFLCKARQEREVGLEVSIVLFPTSCKDLSWPLPVVSWWALNWGVALGSHFSWSAVVPTHRGICERN